MNEAVPAARPIQFYLVVAATAAVMAVIFSPTPDAVSVGLLGLATILTSVVVGAVARRFSARSPRMGRSRIILPVIIGIAGSFLGLVLISLAFRAAGLN
ncbi:hypothetical protein OVA24_16845 [Luteolibacter sp. SL250]|uniref:hypothetical protein n=1 Tax=Luteolibacter sp. SL250 TaxID=2995170 RepID=UPI00226DE7FF|nr:hypothetical protein [Luteolibacter sp. SL250]WAC18901.1 hypothetical protein OVA24_16845 [Luteolibacter sp. SL250]